MKLHEKSCMFDSFCHVCDIDAMQAIAFIGHDGSEHGFHSQELIDLSDHYGYSVTEIQRHPLATHPETYATIKIELGDDRFVRHLTGNNGVLMGMKGSRTHAVSWIGNAMHDSANGLVFPLVRDGKLLETIFRPLVFLKVRRYD